MNSTIKKTIPTTEFLFIPYIMAGYPDEETTIEIALSLQQSGASILELGVPYSDPLADGPIIQKAAEKALKNGMTIQKAMVLVGEMRKKGVTIPIILFTYYNPVLQLEEESFFALARQNDINGLLIPDLPYEESKNIRRKCHEEGLLFISIVAPTSEKRIEMIAKEAKGFLYCVSSLGVTGVRDKLHASIYPFLSQVKKYTSIPIAVGFGISSAEQVGKLMTSCNGIIVGSAILRKLAELEEGILNKGTRREYLGDFEKYISSMLSPISS